MLDPPTTGAASSPKRRVFWGFNLKGDRTVVARFLSLFSLPDPSAVEDLRDQRAGVDETHVQLVVF